MEAIDFGIVFFAREVLKHFNDSLEGKTAVVSGFGNVSWGTITKLVELGAKPITISGPDGYVLDEEGITTPEKIGMLLDLRNSGKNICQPYVDKFPNAKFIPGKRPWEVKTDLYTFSPKTRHNLAVTKGTETMKIYAGLGYYNQESIYRINANNMQRYNFQTNIEADIKSIGLKVISGIIGVVGQNEINTQLLVIGEHEPRVNEDHIVAILEGSHILANAIERRSLWSVTRV